MNLWKQIRLGGAVMCIIAAITHTIMLTLVGLAFMAIGIVGQVDRLEAIIDQLKKEDK